MVLPLILSVSAPAAWVSSVAPTPPWLVVALESGLSVEMVAYSGLSVSEVGEVLAEVESLSALTQAAVNAKAQVRTLQGNLAALKRSQAPDQEAIVTLTSQVETAAQTLRAALESVFDAAVAKAPESKRESLRAWRASRGTKLPPNLRVLSLTVEEIKKIEIALQAESQAVEASTALDNAHSSLLTNVRSRAGAIAASQVSQVSVEAVRTVFASHE